MKTQPASLPAALPSSDMLLNDEVVFRHRSADGQEVEARVPLALGILLAANAQRAGEFFALGYPGDPVGAIARVVGGRVFVHGDAAATLTGMAAFLDRFAEALLEQAAPSAPGGVSGQAAPQGEKISPTAA